MGNGLSNLQERMKVMYGNDALLELSEQAPQGLRVDLKFNRPV